MTPLHDDHAQLCLSPEPGPPDVLEHDEQTRQILSLLEALPAKEREVLRLKFQHGFSYQEISRVTGHSVSNVGYLIHAGIKSLRGQLIPGHPAAKA